MNYREIYGQELVRESRALKDVLIGKDCDSLQSGTNPENMRNLKENCAPLADAEQLTTDES